MVNIHFFIKKMYNKFMENKIKNIHWFPGHMKKASNRIEEQVKLVDFVIVLLDSRIPISSKNNLLEKITQNKRKLYILTKPDLSDDKETLKWLYKLPFGKTPSEIPYQEQPDQRIRCRHGCKAPHIRAGKI